MKDEGAGMEKTSLPFSVTLNDFRLERYPGSHSPMSYESDLVIKSENESPLQATIRMNKVIDVDGYRLFQSSFDSDEQGTVLSVSYDRPVCNLRIPDISCCLLVLYGRCSVRNPVSDDYVKSWEK